MTFDNCTTYSALPPLHTESIFRRHAEACGKSSSINSSSRRRRESHQKIVDLTQCFSRHQISEPRSQIPNPRKDSSQPFSYFDISTSITESPAVSPFTFAPAVQQLQRASRSPSPEWAIPSSTPYSRPSARNLREQRIRNARLMCDSSHRREVALLVERMVDERSQCHIRTTSTTSSSASLAVASPTISSVAISPSSTAASSPVIDQGCEMDMDCGAESDSVVDYPSKTLKFRRSGDLSVMPASAGVVRRDVRIRKPRRQRASGGSGRPWEI